MTDQEAFTKVRNHLLTQMKKSNSDMMCLYRGPEGLKCAIGCLITDEEYSTNLEGLSINGSLLEHDIPSLKYLNKDLLFCLQNIHDNWEVSEWEDELKLLAERHNLIWE